MPSDVIEQPELLTVLRIESEENAEVRRIDSEAEFLGALEEREWDAVISDYNLPGFSGLVALWPLLLRRWLKEISEPPEERNAHRARRVDRRVGHRDRDQVDQGQAQSDGDGGKALRRAAVGRAQNHEQEGESHHHCAHQAGGERIAARRVIADRS